MVFVIVKNSKGAVEMIRVFGKMWLSTMLLTLLSMTDASAGEPIWTLTPSPLGSNVVSLGVNDTVTVNYIVTNKSTRTFTLAMRPIKGITQDTSNGYCPNPFTLGFNQSCTLVLSINASSLSEDVIGGPVICSYGSQL